MAIETTTFDVTKALVGRGNRLKTKWLSALIHNAHCLDADTAIVARKLGVGLFSLISLRIENVDSPEVHSKNRLEKEVGLMVTDVAQAWVDSIPRQDFRVTESGAGKYAGRAMGDLRNASSGETLSGFLLDWKLVKPYKGKTKTPWTDSQLKRIRRNARKALDTIPEPANNLDWALDFVKHLIAKHPDWIELISES